MTDGINHAYRDGAYQASMPVVRAQAATATASGHPVPVVETMIYEEPAAAVPSSETLPPPPPVVATPPSESAPVRKRAPRGSRKASGGNGTSPTAASPSPHSSVPASAKVEMWPTINITLPSECHQWFTEQAAAAPYEPTLAKYLQWQLRELWKRQQAEAAAAEEEKAYEAAARAQYNDGGLGPQ